MTISRVILTGDEEKASYRVREGIRQLDILKGLMGFQKLKQDVRRVRYTDGSEIICHSVFGVETIEICVPEVVREARENLEPRFFAYIVKVDSESGAITKKYFWLYFNEKTNSIADYEEFKQAERVDLDESNELYAWEVSGVIRKQDIFICEERIPENKKELVEKMKEVPYRSPCAFTKSFMVYEEEDEEKEHGQRYAAAAHLLVSGYKNIFEPIHHPNCIGNWSITTPEPNYPRPSYCMPLDKTRLGLFLMCPPNRFYCNTEERIMVWYTAKSNNPEIIGGDYVCGIILDLNKEFKHAVSTFIYYPTDGGEGFETYWCEGRNNQEVPMSMMNEVEELTQEELQLIVPWEGRPIKIIKSLIGEVTKYEQLDSCEHRIWAGKGFDKIPLATLVQTIEVGGDHKEDSVLFPANNCSPLGWDECDQALRGEKDGSRVWNRHNNYGKKHSDYTMTIFDRTLTADSDYHMVDENESNSEKVQQCLRQVDPFSCINSYTSFSKSRSLFAQLRQKNLNSALSSWIIPNIAWESQTLKQEHCVGDALMGGPQWWFTAPDSFDFTNLCDWSFTAGCGPDCDWFLANMSFPCFYGCMDEMPGDIWNRLDNESKIVIPGGVEWTRSTNQIGTPYCTDVNEYSIDGKITLDSTEIDKLYYLDDRATDDNQGILMAGKSDSDELLWGGPGDITNLYKPDAWNIYWKIDWNTADRSLQGCVKLDDGIEYIDVKDKLLEVLDCKMEELIDIGLV